MGCGQISSCYLWVSHQNHQGGDILDTLALPVRASLVNGLGTNASSDPLTFRPCLPRIRLHGPRTG